MNGRQFSFRISGHPVAQFLAMIVIGVVLVGAVIMGAFVFVALLGAVRRRLCRVLGARVVALAQVCAARGPFDGGPEPGPRKALRYIEGEYEVVEADADAARRDSGTR